MCDRERELELCLEDITRLVVIPSAITMHFTQICEIKKTAKSCLNNGTEYTKVIDELKELRLHNGLLKIALENNKRLLESCEQALAEREGLEI